MKTQTELYEFLENFTNGVVIHSPTTEILFANQAALNFLGLSKNQIIGKEATDPRWHFIKENGSLFKVDEYPVNQVIATRKAVKNLVIGVVRPDLDRPLWAVCNAHPEYSPELKIKQIIINFTEITERVQTQEKLRESDLRFSNAFDFAPIGMTLTGPDGKFMKVNQAFCKITGYLANELTNKTFRDITAPEDLQTSNQALQDFLEQKLLTYTTEKRYIHKLGHTVWIRMHISVLNDTQNKPLYFIGQFEDISDRKRKDLEILEISERLRSTYALAHIGVWNWVVATDKVTWTEELYRIAGLDPKLSPPSFAEMDKMHSKDSWKRLQASVKKTLETGESYEISLEYVLPDGNIRNVIAFGGVKRNNLNQITELFGTVQDVTEKERMQAALKEALKNAENSAIIKSRFLDIAAHELRTPITAFSLMLQLTQKKFHEGIPVELSILDRMSVQVDRISQLVIQLLDVSRLERGALNLTLAKADLIEKTFQCIEEFKLRSQKRVISFQKPPKPIIVLIDKLRIFQVLSNILDNAIKYSPEDSPIEVSIDLVPGHVRVSVQDQGLGIPEELQRELFIPFARGPDSTTARISGLGLGLYISREIISLHKGTIEINSKIGSGTKISFEIPLLVETID